VGTTAGHRLGLETEYNIFHRNYKHDLAKLCIEWSLDGSLHNQHFFLCGSNIQDDRNRNVILKGKMKLQI